MAKRGGTGPLLDRGRELAAGLSGLVAAAAGRQTQASHAPFDGSLLGEVPVCDRNDVAAAVGAARLAQQQWAATPVTDRTAVISRFRELLQAQEQDILDRVQAESGKSRLSAFEEFADVLLTADYYRRTAGRYLRPRRRKGAAPVLTRT
ncbi:MAG: aldehyde dehydrogenase family protein, partial [Actinomycetes bacterium]